MSPNNTTNKTNNQEHIKPIVQYSKKNNFDPCLKESCWLMIQCIIIIILIVISFTMIIISAILLSLIIIYNDISTSSTIFIALGGSFVIVVGFICLFSFVFSLIFCFYKIKFDFDNENKSQFLQT